MAKRTDNQENPAQFAGEQVPRQCQICGVITRSWQEHHFDYERHPNTTITLCLKCHNLADERRKKRELEEGNEKVVLPQIESLVTKGFWHKETVVPPSEMMNGIRSEVEKLVVNKILSSHGTLQIRAFEEPFKCVLTTKYHDIYKNYTYIHINLNETGKKRIQIEQSRRDPSSFLKQVYEYR